MISGVDDILTESEFGLGADEIPYFTHEYQDNLRYAKSSDEDEDLADDDEDEDDDYDDDDEDDDEREGERGKKEETAATTVQDLVVKEKVLYAILGALVAGVGLASGLLLTRHEKHRPHRADYDEMMQMTMMMLMQQMMVNQQKMNSNDNNNNGEFHKEEEMSAAHAKIIPSHEQFLRHIKKYGGERIPSEDLKPGDFTYKLKPYRNHEIWKVEKHVNGDIADAYKTYEYMK